MSDTVDNLCDQFSSTAGVHGKDGIFTGDCHPRFGGYKDSQKRTWEERQRQRRQDALEMQKQNRFDAQMRARAIALNENPEKFVRRLETDDDINDETVFEKANEASEVNENRPTTANMNQRDDKKMNKSTLPKKELIYANQLMFSEWLVDIPVNDDFDQMWVMMPCPKGKRCLLVAAQGTTQAYDKTGRKFGERFPSALPGGRGSKRNEQYTILDCIYVCGDEPRFYILDCMCWSPQALYDCDFDCRQFVLQANYDTIGNRLEQSGKQNYYPIHRLPTCAASKQAMTSMMVELESATYELDGLLFYFRMANYEPGVTPLVGWLKPFMLAEIFGIQIPNKFTNTSEGTRTYITSFEQQPKRQWEKNVLFASIEANKQEKITDMNTDNGV